MTFSSLRDIIITILVVIVVLLCVFVSSRRQKWAIAVFIVAGLVVGFAVETVPFENAYRSFSSAEEVFQYEYSKSNEPPNKILLEVPGEDTALVVGYPFSSSSNPLLHIFPKDETGWKIPWDHDLKVESMEMQYYYDIKVLRFKDSKECYVLITSMNGKPAVITDNRGSVFVDGVEEEEGNRLPTYYYGAYIPSFDDGNYVLSINGQEISSFEPFPFSN